MALIDTYRNNIVRKRNELAKIVTDKAKESKKAADAQKKYIAAQKSASSTKSQSILKSKLNEMERAQSDIASANSKIANLEKKIAQKEKEIVTEEKRLKSEEDKLVKKKFTDEKKRIESSKREIQTISTAISQQGRTQSHLSNEQEKLRKALEEVQRLPEKVTVLFMASNPTDTMQLRLDEEVRSIQERIRLSEHRGSIVFQSKWAVRASDILQAINEENPTIIHFSGHGTDTGELVLQNPDGTMKLVSKEAITQAISTASDDVRLVFFNACFSSEQAEAVTQNVEAAIGMITSIGDVAACVFAAQFYSAIGFGLSLEKAFNQAKAALMLEGITEEDTPLLFMKDGADPADTYIVRPSNINEVITS